ALSHIFGISRENDPITVGSIRINIRLTGCAASIFDITETTLMLENSIILPRRNFETANERIPFQGKLNPEDGHSTLDAHQRASVNSFGYGGAITHAILVNMSSFLSDYTGHISSLMDSGKRNSNISSISLQVFTLPNI
ncbi:hypothetical protein K432DRAFT_307894, partial [Lepidopterella palustris CBS 459.81]